MKAIILLLSIFGGSLLFGCASPRSCTIAQINIYKFSESHTTEFSKYRILREANLERYFDLYRIESANFQTFLKAILAKTEQPDLLRHITFAATNETTRIERLRTEMLDLLRKGASSKPLIEFEYSDGDNWEWGFMVLENGNIVHREIWGYEPFHLQR